MFGLFSSKFAASLFWPDGTTWYRRISTYLAPKKKESPISSPPFSISSPLLSKLLQDKSLCKSAEEESDDGHEKNGPFYHPLSKERERRQRRVSFHVGCLADYCRPCSGGRVPVGDEQDTGRRRNAGLGILRYNLTFCTDLRRLDLVLFIEASRFCIQRCFLVHQHAPYLMF